MLYTQGQPRFQSWGSNSLVYGITTLLQKNKLYRSTQFHAVGYIITLIKKLCKKLGVRPHFGEVQTPSGCTHVYTYGKM